MQTFRRVLIFVLVLILSSAGLEFVIAQPSAMKIILKEAQNEKYDTVILGQSHGETGFNPVVFDDEMKANEKSTATINCSRRLLPLGDQYYYLKQIADKNNNTKRVFFEIDPTYWQGKDAFYAGRDANAISICSFFDKIDYVKTVLLNRNYNDTFFNYCVNEDTIGNNLKYVKCKLSRDYRNNDEKAINDIYEAIGVSKAYQYIGRGYRKGVARNDSEYFVTSFNESKVLESTISAFDRLRNYCDNNEIELVCVISAIPIARLCDEKENYSEVHRYFHEFCNKRNIKFFDMNFVKSEYLERLGDESDFTDKDGHMMGTFADRQTKALSLIYTNENQNEFFYSDYNQLLKSIK